MKTLTKTLILICVGLLTCISAAVGQQVSPADLPICSEGALRNYALSIAKMGWRQGWANYSSDRPATNVVGNTGGEDILDGLVKMDMKFNDWNSNDFIWDQITLYCGEMAPWGYYLQVASGGTSYPLGGQPASHVLYPSEVPLLMLNGVRTAHVSAKRPDGTDGYSWGLNVINGHPCLDLYFAGRPNGFLITSNLDGTTRMYPLSKSVSGVKAPVNNGHTWRIPGHYVLQTSSIKSLVTIIEANNDPSVKVDAKVPTMVTFDVIGVYTDQFGVTQHERPATIEVELANGTNKTIKSNADKATEMLLPKGVTRVWFNWEHFAREPLWTGDVGVGVVSTPVATTTVGP